MKTALTELRRRALLVDDPRRPAAFQLVDSLRAPLYRQLLETHPGDRLARLIAETESFDPARTRSSYYWPIGSIPTTIAYVRAKFLSGAPSEELTHIRNAVARSMEWGTVLTRDLLSGFDGASFARIEPHWRWQIAYQAVATICVYWSNEFDPVADWAFEHQRRLSWR